MKKFPIYMQLDKMDCGPTCIRMIAKYYGKNYSLNTLRERSSISRAGVSLLGASDAAESIGLRTVGVKISFEKLVKEVPLPCIAHWKQNHFVVIHKIQKARNNFIIHLADPASGLVKIPEKEFKTCWVTAKADDQEFGICLLLEPSPDFYSARDEKQDKTSLTFLFEYVKPYRKLFYQLILGLIAGSFLQLIFPFLTQALVDHGISNRDINFIYLVLIAQLMLFIGSTTIEFIKGWILLHISSRINISLISDFLIKLMKLPISFFDTKKTGDLLQRIGDHDRIQTFLTSTSLNILFSLFNLVIFGIIMAMYSLKILFVFLSGSILYVTWILIFMRKRKEIDYKRFSQSANHQGNIIQLITGMQEIKLNNCEKQKRWEWERIQAKLFKISVEGLALNQYQQAGSSFINQAKNIIISFISATSVVNGEMTLGMMMAIQYIIGQLNSPLQQMIGFIQQAQDAKISLERLGEIHNKDDEEDPDRSRLTHLPESKSIVISDMNFQYEGPHSEMVLKGINLTIPEQKVTAIVGTSGSGKTTLIKLLLGFYPPVKGEITVGGNNLNNFSQNMWRSKCGVVMQDGFIFSDTIARNICINEESIDKEKLLRSVKIANIKEFIESLPLSYNTKIGYDGHGLSQGQKQRILIARAVYKDPEYLFLDEATNSLDANNEAAITDNFNSFFRGKTVVIVAHRLSSVKNADQIIVLDKGGIIETGTHAELSERKGAYYRLVKNQLELGN